MKPKMLFILPPHSSDYNAWERADWQICRIPPVGLIVMVSYLIKNGFDCHFIDGRELIIKNKTNDYIACIKKIVEDLRPEFIGINMLTALFNEAKDIASFIKSFSPDSFIVAGGPHPSIEPALTFEQIPSIDAICVGGGEDVCLELLSGNAPASISGLMLRGKEDKFVRREVEMNIDKYPFPDYHLIKSDFYYKYSAYTTFGWLSKSLSALTSRSCPFSCKFCAADWSKPYRVHSADYVIEMAKYLATYDINTIAFWDDTIGMDKERLLKICDGFSRTGLFKPSGRLRWRASLRAGQVKPELLKEMKAAGCYHVAIGIESGSDKILKIMNKKSTVELNRQACSYVQEAGLDLGASFMVGVPEETEDDIRQTFDFIKNLNCNSMGCGNFRPLPGSPFYFEFLERQQIDKKSIDWSNLGNFSAEPEYIFCKLSKDRLMELFKEGAHLAYANQYIGVHEDVSIGEQALLSDMAKSQKVKIFSDDKGIFYDYAGHERRENWFYKILTTLGRGK